MKAALKKILRLGLSNLQPPPELSVSQWADRFRFLSSKASAEPGRWNTDRAPYQRGIMDAVNDPLIRQVVLMKSAQVGWTDMLLNALGYHMHQDPAPMLLVQPTLQTARHFSKNRLGPMLDESPELKRLVRDAGKMKGSDSEDELLQKNFLGGQLNIAGANSPAGLASHPVRLVLFDEVDRYPPSAGDEGDPISLGIKRTTTFWNAKILMGSTPTEASVSRINQAFLESDQRYYFVRCIHCGFSQRMYFKQLKFERDASGLYKPGTAFYACEKCGGKHDDEDLTALLKSGEWIATKPFNGSAGFHINELYSPWVSFGQTASEFCSARVSRSRERQQTFINLSLGEPWEDAGVSADVGTLQTRAEKYVADIPDGALVLTAGVDVQDDRLEAEIVGWGLGYESWGIEYAVFHGDTREIKGPGPWADLDAWLQKTRERKSGVALRPMWTLVDSGGHRTTEVYKWCKARHARNVFASKGMGGDDKQFINRPTKNNAVQCLLYSLGVDEAKTNLVSSLLVEEIGAQYCHFPQGRGYDGEYFSQLTAEQRVKRYKSGIAKFVWEKKKGHVHNESLDIRVLNMAAVQLLTVNFEALARNIEWQDSQRIAPVQSAPVAVTKTAPIKRRGGFLHNY
jgi:phage terminase large subunit GpA-like protein